MKKALSLILSAVLCLLLLPCSAEGTMAPDLDLSLLSETFVYAQVFRMMTDPDFYIGKVIRVSGLFDAFEDPGTGTVYTSCVIPDATACCAQGLEFVWAGDHPYPDAYPEPGTCLTVTGRFETYMEGPYMYIHLVDAQVQWG